ncbi:MAG: DUF2914 domain-containing protein [Desulfobacterales bacterium]|nr:DUF2914 domain-containing protein [Desulfobacterales bacterium]
MESLKNRLVLLIFILIMVTVCDAAHSAEAPVNSSNRKSPVLTVANMCEGVEDFKPTFPTIVFSADKEFVYCYSKFDPVFENTFIFHNWYKEEKLISSFKLILQVPSWGTFSRIRIRESDMGPWQVEITDPNGKVFKILSFSITE